MKKTYKQRIKLNSLANQPSVNYSKIRYNKKFILYFYSCPKVPLCLLFTRPFMHDSTLFNVFMAEIIIKNYFTIIAQSVSILDFGCGDGLTTFFIQRAFFNATVVGMDNDYEQLQENRQKYPHINFVQNMQDTIPYKDRSFDLIYLVNVLHHIASENRPKVIKELMRVLKTGGSLLIIENNPYHWRNWGFFRAVDTKECRLLKPSLVQALMQTESEDAKITYAYSRSFTPNIEFVLGKIPVGLVYLCSLKK